MGFFTNFDSRHVRNSHKNYDQNKISFERRKTSGNNINRFFNDLLQFGECLKKYIEIWILLYYGSEFKKYSFTKRSHNNVVRKFLFIYILYKCENKNQCKPLRSIFSETIERIVMIFFKKIEELIAENVYGI